MNLIVKPRPACGPSFHRDPHPRATVETLTAGYANSLEPAALLTHFLRHPPLGFQTRLSAQGVPHFHAPFNLLTTVDPALRRRISRWPGYTRWQRLLTLDSCFVGSTVSEYACLPRDLPALALAEWLRNDCVHQQTLTVVKDLPQQSPLLPDADNHYARELMDACRQRGFISVEGQALAYVPIDFADLDDYLSRLSSSRRRDLRRKLRSREQLRLEILSTGDKRFDEHAWLETLYGLYHAVYTQSDIHFDRLTPAFFRAVLTDAGSQGRVFCYWHQDVLIGFNLCYQHGDMLIDKYIGLRYPQARQHNLYFVSWFANLDYALAHGLKYYVAGWTDPQVKASLGARFTLTRHLVWARHPLLRQLLTRFRHHFESDAHAVAAVS